MPQVPHPLLNHIVILRVLKQVNLKELKVTRLVCKDWHFHATAILPFKSSVKIRRNDHMGRFLETICQNDSENICTFQLPIYRNFVFDSCEFYTLKDTTMSTFFNEISKTAKELTFSNCAFESKEAVHLILELLPNLETCAFGSQNEINFPNSKLLFDKDHSPLKPRRYEGIKTLEMTIGVNDLKIGSWAEILEWFPCIYVLNAQCRNSGDLNKLLEAISKAKDKSALKLTEFSSFLNEFSDSQLCQLIELEFQYTSLDLNVSSSVSRLTLQRLLQSCQNSLEILTLFHNLNPGIPSDFPYELTQLTHLTTLEIAGDMIQSLTFLKAVPFLRNLSIRQHHDDEESMLSEIVQNTEDGAMPHLNLESLTLEYHLLPQCIQRATKLLPNIRIFASYLNDDSSRALFQTMANLEELMVFGTELTDEGITGISLAVLLNQNIPSKTHHRKVAYIANCKKLRHFSMSCMPQENISDYSVHFGFMDAVELNSLDLPETSITNEGIQELRLKPNLRKLSTKHFIEDGIYITRPIELQEI